MCTLAVLADVAPRVGAWIETLDTTRWRVIIPSHPVWVRGLKQQASDVSDFAKWSHPVWVRGLKQQASDVNDFANWVAPRVGAWIETKHCF